MFFAAGNQLLCLCGCGDCWYARKWQLLDGRCLAERGLRILCSTLPLDRQGVCFNVFRMCASVHGVKVMVTGG